MLNLNQIFNTASIRNRIWFGFALILFILLFISLSTFKQFVHLNKGISKVTEDIQPIVLAAQNLEISLETASNMLGFYLLTTKENYRKKYFSQLDNANKQINKLVKLNFVIENTQYSRILAKVKKDTLKLSSYRDKMVRLVNYPMENSPAQRLAAEKLNPVSQQLQSMISQMIESDYDEDNADSSRDEFRRTLYDLRYYNVRVASELRNFLAFRSSTSLENMRSIEKVIMPKLKFIRENEDLHTFEQSNIIQIYIDLDKNYFNDLEKLAKLHSTDKYRTDIYLIKTEIGPLIAEIDSSLGKLVKMLTSLIAETSNELQNEASGASNKIITGLLISLLAGIIIAFLISRMITIPINAAMHAMEDLAQGEGDLTQRLNDRGDSEIDIMARGFNKFAGKVQFLVSQLADSVKNLSAMMQDISGVVKQTQSGSQQQSQQTEQVATAITQITATIHEVASNANLAASSAQQANDNARLGQKVVNETVSSINSLASEIETGVNVINKLSQDTESISSVLDVIKGIAEQTNLLALNAAIEAARAGEQGRGFAVVADEVRTLASRTQQSTTEIESMIGSLQVQAHAAVDAITLGQQKAQTSVQNASNAGDALNKITESVATISSMNLQIAAASEQQSTVSEEINQNIVSISQVAGENTRAANQLADSSQSLKELTIELQTLVFQFKY
ncbi:Methyl-accepting chemotaxis sensor/transducer protein [hydrothermal vent metagenome]|uniref:Methyl-accepting chemotaxis sensor/transducer protein n=1 Tax=hydrothermal vent metagenome TaxID=652676 RepID=A0A3B0XJB7_9ZZZZ